KVVAARNEAMWMLRTYCGYTLPKIGALLGRDHTTVLHGIKKFSTGVGRGVHKSRKPGKPEKIDSKSAKFSTCKTVEAGSISLAGEPRRHTPQPAFAARASSTVSERTAAR